MLVTALSSVRRHSPLLKPSGQVIHRAFVENPCSFGNQVQHHLPARRDAGTRGYAGAYQHVIGTRVRVHGEMPFYYEVRGLSLLPRRFRLDLTAGQQQLRGGKRPGWRAPPLWSQKINTQL